MVTLIGADAGVGGIPVPMMSGRGARDTPEALLIDESYSRLLKSRETACRLKSTSARHVVDKRQDSAIPGDPLLSLPTRMERRYAGLAPAEPCSSWCGSSPRAIEESSGAEGRLPNADVWTRAESPGKSQLYWTRKPAGGAILAGRSGFCIGCGGFPTVYATTMERIEEFATLKVSARARVCHAGDVVQAVACAVAGYLLGIAISSPVIAKPRL